MSKIPEKGEIVCLSSNSKFIYPHGVALYLDDGRIVIPSYISGWTITDFSGLDKCSPFGHYNVKKTYYDDSGIVCGFDYLAYDSGKPTLLEIRKVDGEWAITNNFNKPSWAQRSQAKVAEPVNSPETSESPDPLYEDEELSEEDDDRDWT